MFLKVEANGQVTVKWLEEGKRPRPMSFLQAFCWRFLEPSLALFIPLHPPPH